MKKSKIRIDHFAVTGCALVLLIVGAPALVVSETISVLPASQAPKVVVRGATTGDQMVSGEVLNLSFHRVRDVELLIRHIWHWNNEFRPGENPPGFGDYLTVKAEILPGSSERFSYRLPSSPPSRPDGYFETVVTVAGFTEIVEQPHERRTIDDWKPVS